MKPQILSISFLLLLVFHLSVGKFHPEVYFKKQYPKVSGAFQCGGPGEFVELRYAGCNLDGEMCALEAEDGIDGELDYIPIKDIETLRLKLYAGADGNEPRNIYDEKIPDSSVEAGYKYTISVRGPLDEEMAGKRVKGRWELYDDSDDSLRVCMEAEIQIK